MAPNLNPMEIGYTITFILLAFIFVMMLFPMSSGARSLTVGGAIAGTVTLLGYLGMLPSF